MLGPPTRRAPTNSGRVAPGRRSGKRTFRLNTWTADSRRAHGPNEPQAKQRPVALDVMWLSKVRWASANRTSSIVVLYMVVATSSSPSVYLVGPRPCPACESQP
jgi:hypothetical protein